MFALFRSLLILGLLMLGSCQYYYGDQFAYTDSQLKLNEYDMFIKVRNLEEREMMQNANFSAKMKFSNTIFMPEEPTVLPDKLMSVNITEEVPIIDLIMEISRMADIDVQVDPTISGGIILNIKDKPLRYVFNRICGMTDTRYKEKNGIIIFEKDIPYVKTYYLDFLDVTRSSSSSMSLNTSVISKNGGTSSASVSSNSADQFWGDIEANLKQLIEVTEKTYSYYSKQASETQSIEEENSDAIDSGDEENSKKSIKKSDSTKKEGGNKESPIKGGEMKINKRAGMITITASEKSHRKIAEYLKDLKRKSMAQVLIEMKFVEVTLDKEYQGGIDWGQINLFNIGTLGLGSMATAVTGSPITSILAKRGQLSDTLKLFERFGQTRVLYNPRINAINNQPALFTVARNMVYFKTETMTQPSSGSINGGVGAVSNVKATLETIPIGVIMSVIPSIDLDTRSILLNIKPTISKSDGSVSDPSVEIAAANVASSNTKDATKSASGTSGSGTSGNTTTSSSSVGQDIKKTSNNIPQTSIREFDTIMKINDGETLVIGGFTERRSNTEEKGVPILRSIPLLGNFFKYKSETISVVETIILIKATITESGEGKMNNYEKSIYKTFADDPLDYQILH